MICGFVVQGWGQEKVAGDLIFFNKKGEKITKTELVEVVRQDSASTKQKNLESNNVRNSELLEQFKTMLENQERDKIGEVFMNCTTIEILSNKKDEIKNAFVLNSIQNQIDNYSLDFLEKTVGKVTFKYDSITYESKIHIIDSVKIAIRDGMIEHLQVFVGDRSFYNTKAPISLLDIDRRFEDKLYDPATNNYILLKNAIRFYADRRFNYIPDNDEIALTKTKLSQEIFANKNLNTLLDIQTYTDMLGLLGDEPNGIFQVNVSSKFFLHRKNLLNCFTYIFSDIEPFFHYSKVDSKFETLTVNSPELNPTEIFRRRNYSIGLGATIFQWDFKPANSVFIKAGYQYSSTKMNIDENKTNAIIHLPYGEVGLRSNRLKGFGLNIYGRYSTAFLNNNTLFNGDLKTNLLSFHNSLNYRLSEKSSNELFFRFINYLDLKNRENDYSILQVGFRTSLNVK